MQYVWTHKCCMDWRPYLACSWLARLSLLSLCASTYAVVIQKSLKALISVKTLTRLSTQHSSMRTGPNRIPSWLVLCLRKPIVQGIITFRPSTRIKDVAKQSMNFAAGDCQSTFSTLAARRGAFGTSWSLPDRSNDIRRFSAPNKRELN